MFTEHDLISAAGERVFDRGLAYLEYVHGLGVREREATASIQARRVYTVRLTYSPRGVDGECSCPHNADGNFCKHLVAVGLAVLHELAVPHPTDPECDAIHGYLGSLTNEELRTLVEELAFQEPTVLRFVQARAVAAGAAAVDPDELVALVNDAMPRGIVDYRRSFDAAREVIEALDVLEELLDAGAADETRPAFERAMTRLRKVMRNADDSGGALGDACQRAADLHARSCCARAPFADAQARALGRWLARFRGDSPGWPVVTLDMYASALGDIGVAMYRAAVDKLSDADGYELEQIRLELADYDGDVDEAVRILAAREYGPSYAEIVNRLFTAGRNDDAYAWLDRAVAADKIARSWQRDNPVWISPEQATQHYLAAGRHADALAVARRAFRTGISPVSLQLLLDVAEQSGVVAVERAWAMHAAEHDAERREDGSALVQLALADEDLVSAWSAADRFGPGASWRDLAQASAEDLPIAAADLYRPELDRLLQFADTGNYPQVASILQVMRKLYAKVGEQAVIDALVSEIRERYRRRTSLIAALDKAGLRPTF